MICISVDLAEDRPFENHFDELAAMLDNIKKEGLPPAIIEAIYWSTKLPTSKNRNRKPRPPVSGKKLKFIGTSNLTCTSSYR